MTCIVALRHEGRVYMGADSRVTMSSGRAYTIGDPKLWSPAAGIAVGVCGNLGLLTTAQLRVPWAELLAAPDSDEWLRVNLVAKFRALFAADGINPYKDEVGEPSGTVLIGFAGQIYDFSTTEMVSQRLGQMFFAVGSAMDFALASLFESHGREPTDRVERALGTAAHFHGDVAPPFVFETV